MSATQFDLNPAHIWLDIPDKTKHQAWLQSQAVQKPEMRQLSYINRLMQAVVLPYLKEQDPQVQLMAHLQDFWLLGINGIGVNLGEKRIVLIPSMAWDLEGIQIPQEWVDIPELAADYHIAVQVDLDDALMRLWGYTSHQNLKKLGEYNPHQTAYILDQDDLAEKVSGLWIEKDIFLEGENKAKAASIERPIHDTLSDAIQIFDRNNILYPNRMVPFATWATLVVDPLWRQQVLDKLHNVVGPEQQVVKLSHWLEDQFEQGWQAVAGLMSPKWGRSKENSSVQRAKNIHLKTEFSEYKLLLVLTIKSLAEGMRIQASLYPEHEEDVLPPALALRVLTAPNDVFKEVITREDDHFIRCRFDGAAGDEFSLQIQLGEVCITECFEV